MSSILANLDEQQRQERKKTQAQVIIEGELIENLLKSPAWTIIERTIKAQLENYKLDTRDAAKNRLKDIRAYIGREEALDWFLKTVKEDFISAKQGALQEMIQDEAFYKSETELDREVHEELSSPTFPGMRPGDMGKEF